MKSSSELKPHRVRRQNNSQTYEISYYFNVITSQITIDGNYISLQKVVLKNQTEYCIIKSV